ncbi:MAG TPA: glutamine-hydrolyzing carbamoyl-phosphate synthase small subunit [Deltaproteobacteria bacterium]|nr:glutamine-hydrolyzing carbamoyl-phosphate synthase small subunit [Deltaproteobacteria bacterium]HNS88569.1 glutamine-hydrolyzing carbamoyl-phosphate synthase small subunit [Deltaproteobacteria bacterium]HOA44200.1 glutamine-hydrolyzing carbamoyl-phosphate synthase small subunit [Deltaproteobacteria bacterium]HOC74451.1 glutamine-hydrolyzing carbamoyl-phosphate synthase small subunit [Deltaproteobacteria bacterium]HOG83535.1 glutamine-hydrolyzing carbamoyl-phosphate synthase small subunit [De
MIGKARRPAVLVLEDGTVFRGSVFAGHSARFGEVVFNTGMTGYQEILTDPSYKEQILVMTYPLIGNYGVNDEDVESAGIHLEGFIVREYQPFPSNFRSKRTLADYLEEHHRIGMEGVDTRALTRHIRTRGAMRGVVATDVDHIDNLMDRLKGYPGLVDRDIVQDVTGDAAYLWHENRKIPMDTPPAKSDRPRVMVVDCGVKLNILRMLDRHGCEVVVVPARTSSRHIMAMDPDGVLLSNGPGDPAPLRYLVDTVRDLLGRVPIFGICLGHQILGQALGGSTAKLRFGHHGVNQPVKNLRTGRVEISSQNHGFVVLTETLPRDTRVTHVNLNDNTLEGLSFPGLKAFSVQYHPEAAPGPRDSAYLFREYLQLMGRHTPHGA